MDVNVLTRIKVTLAKIVLISVLVICSILTDCGHNFWLIWGVGWVTCGIVAMLLIFQDWRTKYIPLAVVMHGLIGMFGLLIACIREIHTMDMTEFSKR